MYPGIFYGYALAFILFYVFKFYFMYIVYIRHRDKLQAIALSSVELSMHQDKSVVTPES